MNGGMAAGEYVTQAEFSRTLGFLEEIRCDIKGDVAGLSAQLHGVQREITSRQDIANGRTAKNEGSVDALSVQLDAVQETVTLIKTKGCDRGTRHAEMLTALAAAGVAPETGEVLTDSPAKAIRWRAHAAKGAWAGAGAGLIVLVPHLWSGIHWLLHHLQLVQGTP